MCPNYVFSFIDTFQIFIEDQNIRNLNLKAYRAQIGCVQQETTIFEGTITENIRLGKLNATQEEIEEAAKDANIHEFISRLPEVNVLSLLLFSIRGDAGLLFY